jgi:imidazolonepropionase-like amidohydrolase
LPAKAAPTSPFALHGAVITPTALLRAGYVVVDSGLITDVTTRKPRDVPLIIETNGVILPGLIDLHGHPEFNVFAAWEPPQQFANRYRWRDSDIYHRLVRDPQNVLIGALAPHTQLRYAEVRALVGGVTAIQGASAKTARSPDSEPLVRNVDLWIFGQHKARSMIDLPSGKTGRSWDQLQKVLTDIGNGHVDTFYLHLCEGMRGDQRSQTEFGHFLEFEAATEATVVIHASALSPDQLSELANKHSRMVWSPQSNLRLYGQTTLAGEAIRLGIPVALGADWLPSGSTSLLAELHVARRVLAEQGQPLPADDLVAMVTETAAHVAGLGDFLGAITPGRAADLVVLERRVSDAYENVCQADPSWVELVCIGGDVAYGRADWFDQLTSSATGTTVESLIAWGKQMKLDTGFQAVQEKAKPVPSLSQLRADLIAQYPAVGPVFA